VSKRGSIFLIMTESVTQRFLPVREYDRNMYALLVPPCPQLTRPGLCQSRSQMVQRKCRCQVSHFLCRQASLQNLSYFQTNGFEGNQLVSSYILANGTLIAGTATWTYGNGSAGINDPAPYQNHVRPFPLSGQAFSDRRGSARPLLRKQLSHCLQQPGFRRQLRLELVFSLHCRPDRPRTSMFSEDLRFRR